MGEAQKRKWAWTQKTSARDPHSDRNAPYPDGVVVGTGCDVVPERRRCYHWGDRVTATQFSPHYFLQLCVNPC